MSVVHPMDFPISTNAMVFCVDKNMLGETGQQVGV